MTQIINNLVFFNEHQMRFIGEWAIKNAATQLERDHYNDNSTPRPQWKIVKDCTIGKMAEAAWDEYCKKLFKMPTKINWKLFPKGGDDGADFFYGKKRLEVKGAQEGARWLMCPVHKINKAEFFLFVEVGWERNKGGPGGIPKDWCELHGWVDKEQMKAAPIYKEGELLPNTQCELVQTNYALHIDIINEDILALAAICRNEHLASNMNSNHASLS